MGWETEQSKLVRRLRREGAAGEGVLAVLARVPRDVFVDEAQRHLAFHDTALPIGQSQTISQPTVVAVMTEALEVSSHQKVLEIGTGTGYQTAVLAELGGEVFTVERSPELADLARRRLQYLGYANVHVVLGDGTMGLPSHAPFDRILVTAAAPTVPPALIDQLAPSGRLVLPVGGRADQQLVVVSRDDGGALQERSMGQVRFVPLVGVQGWPE